jgi:hypothetical protein
VLGRFVRWEIGKGALWSKVPCSAYVFAWRYTHLFTVTMVRVDAFVAGVQNSQEITHENNLVGTEAETIGFLRTMAELGDRLGPLLLQLPSSFTVEGWACSRTY